MPNADEGKMVRKLAAVCPENANILAMCVCKQARQGALSFHSLQDGTPHQRRKPERLLQPSVVLLDQ